MSEHSEMLLSRRGFGALSLAALSSAATPKRRWTVYIVQHSHTDVGFTERQEIISSYHADFVRQALELATSPAQKERDGSCRFKYTFEGFWQVEQFLARASRAEVDRLAQAIRSGALELSGTYFNLLDFADAELLQRSVQFAKSFARREQVPLSVAMSCDVNGASWGLAEALAREGILRLSMNINPDQGGYPFGKPLVPFFWETPSAKRLLVWNGLAYHKANLLGLMGGSVPAGDPGIPGLILPGMAGYVQVSDISVAEQKLLPFLSWLEGSGYPYDFLPLMGSGTYTDNSPPGDAYCSILEQWNAKWGSQVHLRSSTLSEFFDRLERQGSEFPVLRGEWTDWWNDSAATSPNDTALYRNALRNRRLLSRLDPEGKAISEASRDEIDRKLLLYSEHTFGYSRTGVPGFLGEEVFARKSQVAVEADEMTGAALARLLLAHGEGPFTAAQPFAYTVLNPSEFEKEEMVGLPVNFWEAPFLEAGVGALDENKSPVPSQVEQSARGWNVFVKTKLAAGESARYELVARAGTGKLPPPSASSFENQFYRISWTPEAGIVSFVQRTTQRELLMEQSGGLGCPVYQIFPGADRSKAGAVAGRRERPHDDVKAGRCTGVRRLGGGPLFEAIEIDYAIPGTTRYQIEVRCYRDLPHFDLTARFVKTEVDDPEGLYIRFPFAVPDSRWILDKPVEAVRPGLDQLPQTCCDYYTVLSGAALAGRELGIAWTTLDAPLIQLGELKLWRFSTATDGTGPLYSWVTNNKWQTNTRYRVGGAYEMRYRMVAETALRDNRAAIERCRELYASLLTMRG